MDDRWMRALLRPLDLLAFLSMTPVRRMRAPRIQGASAGAASHSRKGVGRGLDRPLAASAAGPRPAITARRPVN